MNGMLVISISLILSLTYLPCSFASTQFPKRQLPVYVIPKPQKSIFNTTEPLLIDVEIKNGLKQEIRMSSWAFSPNEWHGETAYIELPDVYRLPTVFQIWMKRPAANPPTYLAAPGWHPIPAGASKIKTIDLRKWEVAGGWIAGTYEIIVRVDGIDIDSYSAVRILSDPIKIEVK